MPGSPNIHFTPGLLPTLAAVALIALTLHLGNWQRGRAEEKRGIQAEWEARAGQPEVVLTPVLPDVAALRFRAASAHGTWNLAGQIFLDNKFQGEAVGYEVVTPLKLDGGETYVLVNRGWLPRGPNYPAPPEAPAPQAETVHGALTIPTHKFLELSSATVEGKVWQNLTIERYREAMHLDVLPLVLNMNPTEAGFKPVSERPDARAEKSTEYMLTWYSLAATTLILWIALNLKIRRRAATEPA